MTGSRYPNGFDTGVSIREIPVDTRLNGKSNVYWVDSVNGSDGNKGTCRFPFATLDYAIGRCTASQGDKIYVAAGHVETVIAAGTVTCDVAGITIIFMGDGSNRGYLNFTTAVAASVIISADNVTIVNPRFVAGIDALTSPITITGANCHIVNGEWYDAAAKAATNCIVASTAATGLRIHGWKYYASTTGTQKVTNIQLTAVSNAELVDIDISGDFSTGNINLPSAMPNLRIENVKLKNTNATPKPGMVIHASSTGMVKNTDVRIVSGTTYVSSVAALNWDSNCLGYNADGEGGDPIGTADASSIDGMVQAIKAVTDLLPDAGALTTIDGNTKKIDSATLAVSPTAGSLARFIASGGTALGTQLAASVSIVDAIGSNGATLVYGAGSILGAIGTEFWVKKTLTSSAIVQAGVDITGVSSIGELAIEDVVVKTDATGLATGTNFEVTSDNANGLANILVETVANLGANKTRDLAKASVTGIRTVLETGKKLVAKSTVADCTGGGTIDIYVKFKRLSAGATVAAA